MSSLLYGAYMERARNFFNSQGLYIGRKVYLTTRISLLILRSADFSIFFTYFFTFSTYFRIFPTYFLIFLTPSHIILHIFYIFLHNYFRHIYIYFFIFFAYSFILSPYFFIAFHIFFIFTIYFFVVPDCNVIRGVGARKICDQRGGGIQAGEKT